MVKAMHRKGLEVILDVVYNHTAEGNEMGPTLSFKGIDNASYYRLADDPRYYINDTGTGNTLNLSNFRVVQFVNDSLRYWAREMHVDGFRFDLATILGREPSGFDQRGGFLDACGQDPLLSQVKLIAEPWDCGPGGYQVGHFPPGWAEWNDKFRDNARAFWRGDEGKLAEFATRFTGSADLFDRRGRRPWSSVNFITAHDGFTLRDLVSYNEKHNEANGENNQRRLQQRRLVQLRRGRATDDAADQRAACAADAQPAGHAAAGQGHADAAGRRRARADPGRQQQHLLPGQRDHLDQLGRRPDRGPSGRLRAPAHRAASSLPHPDPWPLPQWPVQRAGRGARPDLAQPWRQRDGGRALERWRRAFGGPAAGRQGAGVGVCASTVRTRPC